MTVVQASYSSPISYAPAFAKVRELLAAGIEEGVFPGAVLMVGKRGEIIFQEAVGVLSKEDPEVNNPMRLETVFDIASLTQPIVTSTLMMLLLERGKLKLSDKVTRYVPGFGVHGKSDITIKHLLEHTSGLVHWHPFYEEIVSLSASSRMGILASSTAKDYVYQQVSRLGLKHKPGTMQVFSDVGYIILGQIAERLIGAPLNKIAYKMIFQPLGMNSTTYIDLPMLKRGALEAQTDMVAPTEYCAWRKRTLIAEAHDDNAWAMGGISGHGGLFTTARDLHIFASNMLAASLGLDSIVSQKSIREFWYPWVEPFAPKAVADGQIRSNYSEAPHKWRFGWEGPNEDNRMLEGGMSPFAVGHSGFTGCSVWLEPELGLDIILMTNRIHPSRNNKKILDYRPKIHEAVIAAVI